jgi:hypothetical protein
MQKVGIAVVADPVQAELHLRPPASVDLLQPEAGSQSGWRQPKSSSSRGSVAPK